MIVFLWLLLLNTSFASSDIVWLADLENDDGGFNSSGDTLQWQWGTISTAKPGTSFDGTRCWATGISRNYLHDADDYLGFPAIDLSGIETPLLVFYQWYAIQSGDYGLIEANQGGVWTTLYPVYGYPDEAGYTGDSGDWLQVYVDLTGLDSLDLIRLHFHADDSVSSEGWYVDNFQLIDGDIVPPDVSEITSLGDTEDLEGPYLVEATVSDNVVVQQVLLVYSVDGSYQEELNMTLQGTNTYLAGIPAQALDSIVEYQVEASDGYNQVTEPDEPLSFRVRLPAPTNLSAAEKGGPIWGTTASLTWTSPDSIHQILGYAVYRDGTFILEEQDTEAEVPLVSGIQEFTVSGIFDVGEGDQSQALELEGAVPVVEALQPSEGYQSDTLRLMLTGEYLLLVQNEAYVDLGDGIRVLEMDVRDVDMAYIKISIAGDAEPGSRKLTLVTFGLELEVDDAFTVLDGDSRPSLLSLQPESMYQGEAGTLTITASEPFEDTPEVRIGSEIVIEDVRLVTDTQLQVDIAIPYTTGLGEHGIEVDDGTRIFTGLKLKVLDVAMGVDNGCSCATATIGGSRVFTALPAMLAFLLSARRRQQVWNLPGWFPSGNGEPSGCADLPGEKTGRPGDGSLCRMGPG